MQLILFDIDGTLVDSGGAGVRSLDQAFKEVLSIENAFREISMAGKTDLQIVKEGLSAHGLSSDNGLVPRITDAYIRHLTSEIQISNKHLKPGIIDALEAVKSRGDRYQLGLLTGNMEQGARIKLGVFGLNEYFASGAFGSDHEDRNKLLPIAVERFKIISGGHFDFADCVVIGDTPLDIMCARPYDAVCIAVATGPYGAGSLVAAGADVVVEDLSDTDHFLNILHFLEK
jgi:phosphoglycolate phosphatase-like HAD superfamily hydrolase